MRIIWSRSEDTCGLVAVVAIFTAAREAEGVAAAEAMVVDDALML